MPGGAQWPAALRSAQRNDSRLLEHGVSIRTIGLDSIRNDPATLATPVSSPTPAPSSAPRRCSRRA